MRNCPAWIVAYMAIVKAGGVATLLNGWWQSHELEHALSLAEPKLVIADAPRAKRIAGRLRRLPDPYARGRTAGRGGARRRCLTARDPAAALPEIAPEDDATILFTSGSTGEAKGALSTHRAVTTGDLFLCRPG